MVLYRGGTSFSIQKQAGLGWSDFFFSCPMNPIKHPIHDNTGDRHVNPNRQRHTRNPDMLGKISPERMKQRQKNKRQLHNR